MDLFKQIRTFFQNIITVNQEFEILQNDVQNSNYLILLIASVFSFLSFFFLFLITLFSLENRFSPVSYLYISYSLVCLLFLIINVLILQKRKKFLIFFIYLFMIFLFSFAFYLDIYKNREHPFSIFNGILFIVPVLFIDKIYRLNFFTLIITIFFIILSFLIKPYEVAMKDMINAFVFLFLEIIFCTYFVYIRLRDFLILHSTEREDFDDLMGILNKKALIREITKHLLISKTSGLLILIDFKNFKQINDFYGMDFGDSILKLISEELKKIFRNNDVIGRYAGDKIIVFMPKISNTDVGKIRSKMFLTQMEENIQIPQNAFTLTANIGITSCSEYGETTKSLLKKAETALTSAKTKGFNQIVIN